MVADAGDDRMVFDKVGVAYEEEVKDRVLTSGGINYLIEAKVKKGVKEEVVKGAAVLVTFN